MKSITIHNLDSKLARKIERMAATSGLSQNKLIKQLLRKALGLSLEETTTFDKYAKTMTSKEANNLEKSLANFNEVDEELWK